MWTRLGGSFPEPHAFTFAVLAFSLLFLIFPTGGALVNTTIDDRDGGWTWTGDWTTGLWATCRCRMRHTTMELGSAIYIYGIDQANFMAGMVFTLGSDTATHYYPNTEPIIFRSLFFSASDPQEVVFDYAVVTSEEVDVPSSGPGKPVVVGNTSGRANRARRLVLRPQRRQCPPLHLTPSRECSVLLQTKADEIRSSIPSSSSIGSSLPSSTTRIVDDTPPQTTGTSASMSNTLNPANPSATTDIQSSSSSKHYSYLGPIVGTVLAALAVLAVLLLCIRRRRQRANMLLARPDGQIAPSTGHKEGDREAGYTLPPISLSTVQVLQTRPYPTQPQPEPEPVPHSSTSLSTPNPPLQPEAPEPPPAMLPPIFTPPQSTTTAPQAAADPSSQIIPGAGQLLSPTQRERLLEERLAELEARLADGDGVAPPSYHARDSTVLSVV
ncbi:hypothetical protein B0H13DRAFT_1935877 [Mycena leptocephala]|nr:hypothetical protein B0H13DRAFT_1935877 [Mycena leptocephala]